MKRNLSVLLSLVVLASVLLAACGGAATEAPAMTEAPAATAEATEAPAATEAAVEPTPIPDVSIAEFDGTSLSVPASECNGAYIGLIQSVVATDEKTATFTLCRPDPAFLSKIAFNPYSIYPSEWLETATATDRIEKPVGTGPYMVDEWKRGDSVNYTANPDYWGEAPAAETLVIRWSTESASRLLELQSGTVDGIDNVGKDDFAVIEGDSSLHLQVRSPLNVMYFGMTNTVAPFDNIKVRQALAMGIDRQRIVDNFYPAGSTVASHFTPCAIPNGCTGDAWYDYDVEAAKALLAEAGFPDGFSTKLYYRDVSRSYASGQGAILQDLQAQLKENLNIDSEIVVMESGTFIPAATGGELDGIFLLGWGADYPHITNFLDYHFGAAYPSFGEQSPTYTDLLVEAAQIADPAEAEPLYVQINNAIRDFVPMIPIANSASATAYRADVTNPQASPLVDELFALSDPGGRDVFTWMQSAEPISLFCADESDGESLHACEQATEALYAFEMNGSAVEPALATSCDPNEDLTVWTCTLREGVKFHDGTDLDAADVVATFNMGLNIASPTHIGNTATFSYYDNLFGFMKKPGQ